MDTVRLASRLVQIASPSGDWPAQLHVVDAVLAELLSAVPATMLEITRSGAGEQPWALVETAGNTAPALLFACHVDTVPVPSPAGWARPPHAGTVTDGWLHGRGSVDMKGGLAVAASAVAHGVRSGSPVALLLTSDEEIGCHGAAAASSVLRPGRIGAVVIPEATENAVVLGHRGAWWARVTVTGRAAHGSTPHLGANAALALAGLVTRAGAELPLRGAGPLGAETWNLGLVEGGEAANIVPERASAVVDHRVCGPADALEAWWRDQPETAEVETLLDLPALQTPADDAWVRELPAPTTATPAPYYTDGAVLAATLPGVPVAIWGPGSARHMHGTDEAIELAQLDAAHELFVATVDAWGR